MYVIKWERLDCWCPIVLGINNKTISVALDRHHACLAGYISHVIISSLNKILTTILSNSLVAIDLLDLVPYRSATFTLILTQTYFSSSYHFWIDHLMVFFSKVSNLWHHPHFGVVQISINRFCCLIFVITLSYITNFYLLNYPFFFMVL